jgi:flagellar assembly protein FliH
MTSTSFEPAPVVLRGDLPNAPAAVAPVAVDDLRAGTWTRLGASTVLGDSATEATLGALADRTRAAGMAQGFAAGWAEGRQRAQEAADEAAAARAAADEQAMDRLRADQQALVAALAEVATRCDAVLADRQELLATEAVDLGLRIAEAVLGRELAAMTDAGAEALRRALAEVPPTLAATVRLHPADAAALDPAETAGRPVTVVADPGVATGSAILETEVSTVDASIETAFARVREVLGR